MAPVSRVCCSPQASSWLKHLLDCVELAALTANVKRQQVAFAARPSE